MSGSDRKAVLAACLEHLVSAEASLSQAAAVLVKDALDGRDLAMQAMKSSDSVFELKSALWDLEPDLVDPMFVPMTDPELADAMTRLPSADTDERARLLRRLVWGVPEAIAYHASGIASEEARADYLCQWWSRADRPFLRVDELDKQLDDARRWRRIVAARALASIGADLIDPSTGEVDPAAVAAWRASRPDPQR